MNKGNESSSLRGRRILIVEDEMLIAMELENSLRNLGCTVLGPVPDIKRALALLKHEQPDAALLDLNLNGKSAMPVASALSAKGVPFLLLTGYSLGQSNEAILKDAPRLTKPVSARELERAVKLLLCVA